MIIFSSYRVDPLLYYGSISLEIYPCMDCGYSGTDIPVVAEHGEQVGSMCNVHVLRVLTYYRYLIYSARRKHARSRFSTVLMTTREKHATFFVEQRNT